MTVPSGQPSNILESPSGVIEKLGALAPALRHDAFRTLFLTLLPGTLGLMMAMVATGFVAYQITGSATMLALTTSGHGLSMAFVSPVAGVVADRFSRLTILRLTQLVLGLSAATVAALLATDHLEIWHLVAVSILQGTAFAFNMPARQAYMAELVPPMDLPNAIALNNAGLNLNRVLGPALAGVLLSWPAFGPVGVFVTMAVLYGVVLTALQRLPARPPGTPSTGKARGGVLSGMQYVWRKPALRRILFLAALPTLFGMPYQTLMPATADRVFHVGATGLGALLTANGVGALIGSILVTALTGRTTRVGSSGARLHWLQFNSGVLMGAAVFGFGMVGYFYPALVLVAIAGGASGVYMAVNSTLLMQQSVPDYHGRVMSVYMMAFATMALGSIPAAWVADQIGLPLTLSLSGVACAGVVFLLGRSQVDASEAPRPVIAPGSAG